MTGAGNNRVVMQMKTIGLAQTQSIFSTVCILGALQRKEDLQGVFVKSVMSLNLKVFLWNFYRTGAPQKITNPQKIAKKKDFLSLAFYNAPSLRAVNFFFC